MKRMEKIDYFDYMYNVYGYTSYNDIIRKNIDGTIEEAIDIDDLILNYKIYIKTKNKNSCCVQDEEIEKNWKEVTNNTPYISDINYKLNSLYCSTYINYYDFYSIIFNYILSNGFKDFKKNISDINNWNDTLLLEDPRFIEKIFNFIENIGYYDNREVIYKYINEQFDYIFDICGKEKFIKYALNIEYENLPESFLNYLINNNIFNFTKMSSSLNNSIKLLKIMFKTSPTSAVKICKKHSIDYKYFLKCNI